jgi:3-hydroxyacyl-CoA dehydrogenase
MPPFVLLALVGPAIALHNSETLHGAFGDRFYVSENLRKIVAAKKSAIYVWDSGKPEVDPEIAEFFEVADPPTVLTADEVRERVLSALADEARRILDEGVVAAPEDIDLAMITGAGFQFWNGGLTQLLDREGISEKVTGKRFH